MFWRNFSRDPLQHTQRGLQKSIYCCDPFCYFDAGSMDSWGPAFNIFGLRILRPKQPSARCCQYRKRQQLNLNLLQDVMRMPALVPKVPNADLTHPPTRAHTRTTRRETPSLKT